MSQASDVLSQAYSAIQLTGQPLSFENNCIQNMFLLPERIQSFQNDDLYLKWINALIAERNNVSFSENPEDYERYFQDCIALKEQMNPFSEKTWLSCSTMLFENLKTPYYSIYSNTLLNLEKCFSDHDIFFRTLRDFYSVIIKSTVEKQHIIEKIAESASSYKKLMPENEKLLSEIFLNQLASFAGEKDFWLIKLFSQLYIENIGSVQDIRLETFLDYFQKREILFIAEEFKNTTDITISDYLSARNLWFFEHRQSAPAAVFSKNKIYTGTHTLPSDSFLGKYAYNMTSSLYITNPAIGREMELQDLELILISPKKSPILLGEAGVGKTSIVEGLSWLIQKGNVPKLLKNKQIYKLTTTSILSGTKYVGEMEERVRQLMDELMQHPEIILFIDEIHTIVGAGSTESSNNDISNMFKPYIDRGSIKIIGSTTTDEYRQYVMTDKALVRRFYPITVDEPDEDTTLKILLGTIPSIEYATKVENHYSTKEITEILNILIHLSHKNNQPEGQRTRNPELPLSLLEMAFSYAALHERNYISLDDFINAVRHTNLLKKEIKISAEQYFTTLNSFML